MSDDFFEILSEELDKLNDSASDIIEEIEAENDKHIIKKQISTLNQRRLAQIGDIFLQKYIDLVKSTHDLSLSKKYFDEESKGFISKMRDWFDEKLRNSEEDNPKTLYEKFNDVLNGGLVVATLFNFFMGGKIKTLYERLGEAFDKICSFAKDIIDFVHGVLTSEEAKKIYKECLGVALVVYQSVEKVFKKTVSGIKFLLELLHWDVIIQNIKAEGVLNYMLGIAKKSFSFLVDAYNRGWRLITDAIYYYFSDEKIDGKPNHEIGIDAVVSDVELMSYITHGVEHRVDLTETTEVITPNHNFNVFYTSPKQRNLFNRDVSTKNHQYEGLIGYETRKEFISQLRNSQSDVLGRTMETFINSMGDTLQKRIAVPETPPYVLEYETKKSKNDLLAIYNEVSYFKLDEHFYSSLVREPMKKMTPQVFEESINDAFRYFYSGLIYALTLEENKKLVAKDLMTDAITKQLNISSREVFNYHRRVEIQNDSIEEKREHFEEIKPTEEEIELYNKERENINNFNTLRIAAEEQRNEIIENIFASFKKFFDKIDLTFDYGQIKVS